MALVQVFLQKKCLLLLISNKNTVEYIVKEIIPQKGITLTIYLKIELLQHILFKMI